MIEDVSSPYETSPLRDQYQILPREKNGVVQRDSDGNEVPDKIKGGMAVVYRARRENGMEVALKTLRTDSGVTVDEQTFMREANLLAQLEHPNIVPIYDYGYYEIDGERKPTMVMKYVRGERLTVAIGDEGLPPEQAIPIILEVASAIDYANQHGVLVRDIKPDNVLLTAPVKGSEQHAMVADLGVANLVFTPKDGVCGTPQWMTREQAMGLDKKGDSEEFAVALVAFNALTGHSLLVELADAKKQMNNDPSELEPYDVAVEAACMTGLPVMGMRFLKEKGYDAAVYSVFDKALARDADKRYPSSTEFAEALAESVKSSQAHV